ncbi:uncharacterized protein J3D65DRAFT_641488 [Phyllosticta citribraziliensis]|uniref:BTB domain-containing protein n=1 Tax=Phyllosticta citribraziliensis TaxID=989973 RepID=A0ABR1L3R8_9PEZI
MSSGEFFSALGSRPIRMEIGLAPKEVFFIHEALLCAESPKYRAMLGGAGNWREKREDRIAITEEDPLLFRSFANYLYRDKWTKSYNDPDSDIVHLTRLYCLADRLMACTFKQAVLHEFARKLEDGGAQLTVDDVCDVLEIAFTELPERRNEDDPLQHYAAQLGAFRLHDLQKHPRFNNELSRDVPEIARRICLRIGSLMVVMPSQPIRYRFFNPTPAKPYPRFQDTSSGSD